MSKSENSSENLAKWNAETLRVTAFLGEQTEIPHEKWWIQVTGEEPERITQTRSGETRAVSTYKNSKLIYVANPMLIEWRMSPLEVEDSETLEIPTIGGFLETLAVFQEISDNWLSLTSLPKLNRLAFGAVLLLPIKATRQGYYVLRNFLHSVRIDPENSSDLFYQINRGRDSNLDPNGIKLNRLSRWSVITLQNLAISNVLPQIQELDAVYAVRLELDINTLPNKDKSLNMPQVKALFVELMELGKEIAEKGDIQ